MSQRYERISGNDVDNSNTPAKPRRNSAPYDSPPPSFRSRASSFATPRQSISENDPLQSEAQRTLADTFDDGSNSDNEDDSGDRQRLMRGLTTPETSESERAQGGQSPQRRPQVIERQCTQLPVFTPQQTYGATPNRVYGRGLNDGVFANLSAKPGRGEDAEEKPPSYEQAAADATPPYWETTILTPSGISSDTVFIDGLPVGSVFSFVWNAMISMSFQLVGFLLTYLLHTTHAAKNGSKAGLGITLVQYGFSMKGGSGSGNGGGNGAAPEGGYNGTPPDPNAHDFDPNAIPPVTGAETDAGGISVNEYLAYILMIVGWFILIKSISEYLRTRRHEQLVLQSPERGLNVPIIADGERPESAV